MQATNRRAGTSAGVLFDPQQPGAIECAVEQVLSGSRTRQQLAASARRRFLTWRETTNQLLAFYRAAIGTEGRGDAERPRTAAPVGAGVPG